MGGLLPILLPATRFTEKLAPRGMKPLLVGRSGVNDMTATVAAYSYVGLLSVGQKALKHAQARAVLANHGGGFIGEHLLVGASLDKFAGPEAACVARRFARG